jgi:hypothetical protein
MPVKGNGIGENLMHFWKEKQLNDLYQRERRREAEKAQFARAALAKVEFDRKRYSVFSSFNRRWNPASRIQPEQKLAIASLQSES